MGVIMIKTMLANQNLAALLLRAGLAFVFLYAAIGAFIEPDDWVGFLPGFLTDRISGDTLLPPFSVGELVLAAWLLSGVYVRYAALASAAMLAGITLAGLSSFIVTFRDVGLLLAALALAALPTNAPAKSNSCCKIPAMTIAMILGLAIIILLTKEFGLAYVKNSDK